MVAHGAEGEAGVVGVALTHQGQIEGGGPLVGLHAQGARALLHLGPQVADGAPHHCAARRGIQRQHLAVLPGGEEHRLAEQPGQGQARSHRHFLGVGRLCGALGDEHEVALNGVALGGTVAAVGLFHRRGRALLGVQGNVALHHLLLRGQVACHHTVVSGGKSPHGQGGYSGGCHRQRCDLTAHIRIQSHLKFPPVAQPLWGAAFCVSMIPDAAPDAQVTNFRTKILQKALPASRFAASREGFGGFICPGGWTCAPARA